MNIALGFATIDRVFAAERLIQSAQLFFPEMNIYVVDQSSTDGVFADFCITHKVQRIRMPYDCGVSAARNALVKAIDEEYFVLCDDDFILTPETSFAGALKILKANSEIGVVGGFLSDISADGRQPRHWEMFLNLDRTRRTLSLTPIDKFAPIIENAGAHRFFHCDTVLNFALMRRSIFDETVRWDPMFKCNGEHEDFYLNLKQNSNVKVVYHPGMRADHQHVSNPEYLQKRARQSGLQNFLDKWDIDQHLDLAHGLYTRKTFSKNENVQTEPVSKIVLTAQGNISATSVEQQKTQRYVKATVGLDGSFYVNTDRSKSAITSIEHLNMFSAFDPVIASDEPATIRLRIENKDYHAFPSCDISLDLLLRWRSAGRYLNWSGIGTTFKPSKGTHAEWHPHQIKFPFSLSSTASIDLEIWDKACDRLLTICNFTAYRKQETRLYSKFGLCIGHTPDISKGLDPQKQNHLAISELPSKMNWSANRNRIVDISKHVGLSWSFEQKAKECFALPNRFPYSAASLIVPRQYSTS